MGCAAEAGLSPHFDTAEGRFVDSMTRDRLVPPCDADPPQEAIRSIASRWHAKCSRFRDMANAIQFKVNGVAHSFDGDPDTPLLWYLRDSLGLTGTKFGCGVGLCGACTVHKGDDAIRACITPMSSLAGAKIRTIEDIGANGLHPVQKMWMQFNVPQCGYCQSGQIMQAIALLKEKPKPTDEDIDEGMAANICRCGTYQRIRAAIKAAAQEPA
jgi:isoquinoline 1-oxidoreductase subunit alpha